MKVISFNVNGIRARLHQLEKLVEKHSPDIIGLQEVKVQDSEFPQEVINNMGYHVEFHGQKGHYGVAIMSKLKPVSVTRGFVTDTEDSQKRLISACFEISGEKINVINGYFPQGESIDHPTKYPAKKRFYQDLNEMLQSDYSAKDNIIVMGDFNIAIDDKDVGIGENNAKRWLKTGKCCFLPEEREWIHSLLGFGFKDTFRFLYPNEDNLFSWFDYRSKGFNAEPKRGLRIDFIFATEPLNRICSKSIIDYEIRGMEKPSDHCPVLSEFDL